MSGILSTLRFSRRALASGTWCEPRGAQLGCADSGELLTEKQHRANSSLLTFEGLEKYYGSVRALSGINLHVEAGSVLALLGPNGAGKSTLFGCLLGLVRPNAGSIQLNGRVLSDADRRRFGYAAERVALYPQRTVFENASFFAGLKGQPKSEVQRHLQRVGLDSVQKRPVRQLSKGMLQRLGLAIALCGEPEVLVLDEPFNGLDPAVLCGFQRILREEQARGATLLISTHTMSAVEPLATHVAILLGGRLALSDTLENLRAEADAPRTDSTAAPCSSSLEAIYHRIALDSRSEQEVFA